jgi:hypothetical protein
MHCLTFPNGVAIFLDTTLGRPKLEENTSVAGIS